MSSQASIDAVAQLTCQAVLNKAADSGDHGQYHAAYCTASSNVVRDPIRVKGPVDYGDRLPLSRTISSFCGPPAELANHFPHGDVMIMG